MIRLLMICLILASTSANAATVKQLSKFSHSWDGVKLHYPTGDLEITAVHIKIDSKEALVWHCHPIPILAYIISGGPLKVETKEGKERVFNKGDVVNEVVGTVHRGVNMSETPVEIVVFYTGEKDTPTTVPYKEGKMGCNTNHGK